MLIRRANENDLNGVNSLLCQVLTVHAEGRPDIFIAGQKKYTDDELIEIFKNDETPVFVAENEAKQIVGYAFCVYKETENSHILHGRREIYIDDLCVDEKFRGKHIGTELFQYIETLAAKQKIDAITLNVWALNKPAMKFYEKCGFTPLKTIMEKKTKA